MPMTLQQLRGLVKQWDLTNPDDSVESASKFQSILDRLEWFGSNFWNNYLPANHPTHSSNYAARLANWVGNVESEDEQKLLLEYATHIAYFSHADLCSLYYTAFSGPISRWIISRESLSLKDVNFKDRLKEELNERTWYCSITDSMKINDFYNSNLISGISWRPDFSSLCRTTDGKGSESQVRGTVDSVQKFITNPGNSKVAKPLKRLVLLEDFVGSGTQAKDSIEWALKYLDIPVLFVPLVICSSGMDNLLNSFSQYGSRLSICPLSILTSADLLGPKRGTHQGIPNALLLETLALTSFTAVSGDVVADKRTAPYSPFGFKETGASFVSYSNTPNNTLPLIHHKPAINTWQPLFPRSTRI